MLRQVGVALSGMFLSAGLLVAGVASAAEPTKNDPSVASIQGLIQYGESKKDAMALLTAVRMLKDVKPAEKNEGKKASECVPSEGSNKVNPRELLKTAAAFAKGNAQLTAEIEKEAQSLSKPCGYQYYCNVWGCQWFWYCW